MASSPSPSPRVPEVRAGAGGTLDRPLPFSREAERATLGCMLLSKEAIGEVITVLRDAGPAAFLFENHQALYEVLVAQYQDLPDKPHDGLLLQDELKRRGLWERLGGFEFLGGLIGAVASALRARHYAEIVMEKHLLRQVAGAASRITEAVLKDDAPAKETLDFAEAEILKVTERRTSGEAQPLRELLVEVARLLERRGDDIITGERTGFDELDEMTSGLQRGELIVIAARPSMGKTAFGLNVAEQMSIDFERPTLFFSMEMSKEQVTQRILCSRAQVNSHNLRRGRISDDDLHRLKRTADELAAAPLYVDATANLTILELRARARIAHRRYGIACVLVDYLQLMHAPRSENRQTEVAGISRGLKALAIDLNVPVVALAQLNRNTEDKSRRGNRPRMSDLRESGAIEQDADVVGLLHREAYYKGAGTELTPEEERTAELILAKQRNGPVGDVKLLFIREFSKFRTYHPGGERYEGAYPTSASSPF